MLEGQNNGSQIPKPFNYAMPAIFYLDMLENPYLQTVIWAVGEEMVISSSWSSSKIE